MGPEWIAWSSIGLNTALCVLNGSALPLLRARTQGEPPEAHHGVDVVMPARDEEEGVGGCLESLLDAGPVDGVLPRVFVVDDESRDDTARVLDAVAKRRRDERLQVIRGAPRPDSARWVGKNWACAQGARRGQGSWLVFLDADVRVEPGALQAAIDVARACQSDLLSVIPRIHGARLFERLIDPPFWGFGLLMLSSRALGLLRGTALPSCTPGAFLVFRREAYEALGGHAAVSGEAVEDVAMAQRASRAGLRVQTCVRPDLASTPTPDWGRVIHSGSGGPLLSLAGTGAVLLAYAVPWLLLIGAAATWDAWLAALAALAMLAARANLSLTSLAFGLRGHGFWLDGMAGLVAGSVWLRALLVGELGWQVDWKGRSVSADARTPSPSAAPPPPAPLPLTTPRHDVRAS